ncbi:ZFYVE1 [Mytilus edulis]|uniref:Zinc finger FYVE domain-containing protein 1 n=2 Tax=Mytilus TaxID=6548 RepID=A0A8B6FHT4_MYTGA|nr:ZFYVE1 [Mytilus edulis]VDI49444.1 zinc finger FYVE domain-containing protein 1 [Mytilus galloprovincialis]
MTSVKKFRTRTSKRFCAEKLCCRSESTVATFHCEDCGSDQCEDCCETIHSTNVSFELHDRNVIKGPHHSELCQISKILPSKICIDENFADLWCEVCCISFCNYCFEVFHKLSSRKTHRKISFKEHKLREQQKAEETLHMNIQSMPLPMNIQPLALSPVSDDDSLTYISFPQEESNIAMINTTQVQSVNIIPDLCVNTNDDDIINTLAESMIESEYDEIASFMLLDDQEQLKVSNEEDFLNKLECDSNDLVKVVSIFGNTGDGKSFTLNHTFFGGKEVFETSAQQKSCTIGVWAAYDSKSKTIVIDTEGMLGLTSNQNQRSRLLLKVLAVSDIIIYRTRAERLHTDMFQFLCDASATYYKYFSTELQEMAKRIGKTLADLTPAVIVFHETVNTQILSGKQSADSQLWDRFSQLDCKFHFKDLHYVGVQTKRPPTDFTPLKTVLETLLGDKTNRASKQPNVIYCTLKNLNDRFSGHLDRPEIGTFPDQIFSCPVRCLSCQESCIKCMNHCTESDGHETEKRCTYQHQYQNKVFLCKTCLLAGKHNVVVPKTSESTDNVWMGLAKYVWTGEVLECPKCGVIYRSRERWYGNKNMEDIVSVEVRHVWPDGYKNLQGTSNAARKVIDSMQYIADSVTSVSQKPTKMISDWMTDQIAPDYWVPNSQITNCKKCQKELDNEQKHHCRACGEGFCDDCSSKKRLIPERGWNFLVRVCDDCYSLENSTEIPGGREPQVTARKVGEVLSSAISVVGSTVIYPVGMLKDSARPTYWTPDEHITKCCVCETPFGPKLKIHHCRACGEGVCHDCSPDKRPVPLRGWDYPVRVCQKCFQKKDKV